MSSKPRSEPWGGQVGQSNGGRLHEPVRWGPVGRCAGACHPRVSHDASRRGSLYRPGCLLSLSPAFISDVCHLKSSFWLQFGPRTSHRLSSVNHSGGEERTKAWERSVSDCGARSAFFLAPQGSPDGLEYEKITKFLWFHRWNEDLSPGVWIYFRRLEKKTFYTDVIECWRRAGVKRKHEKRLKIEFDQINR